MNITLDRQRTALLIADFYAEQMGKLPHAVSRRCLEKTLALRQAARTAGILVCYSATVFRAGYPEVSERNKIFSERKRSSGLKTSLTNIISSAPVAASYT